MKKLLEPYAETEQMDENNYEDCGGMQSFHSYLGPTLQRTHCTSM